MTVSAETAYLFRHALLREAAYQSHEPAARAALHGIALEIIEELAEKSGAENLNAWAEELAEHAAQASHAKGADRITLQSKELEYLERGAEYERKQWQTARATELYLRVADHPLADKHQRVEALNNAVNILGGSGGLERAAPLQSRAMKLAEESADDRLLAQTLMSSARLASSRAQYDEADRLSRKALRLAERLKALSLKATILIERARIAAASGNHRETEKRARAAWKVVESFGAPTDRARSQLYMAEALWQQGRMEDAETHFRNAAEAFEAAGQIGGLASAVDHLGSLLNALGKSDEALVQHRRAADLYARAGDVLGRASATSNIGNIHLIGGCLEEARGRYAEALGQIRDVGQPWLEGVTLGNLGTVNRKLGRLEEAASCLQRARDMLKMSGRVVEHAVFESVFGSLLLLLGYIDAANLNAAGASKTFSEIEAETWQAQYPGLLQVRILVHGHLNGGSDALMTARAQVEQIRMLLKRAGKKPEAGLVKTLEISDGLLSEAENAEPLVFNGYLIDELEPPLRLALLDRMNNHAPEDWQTLQNQPRLLEAMQADTDGLPTPDWQTTTDS